MPKKNPAPGGMVRGGYRRREQLQKWYADPSSRASGRPPARRSFLLFNNSAHNRFKAEAVPVASFSREEMFGWDRPKRSVMQRLPRLASIHIELAALALM